MGKLLGNLRDASGQLAATLLILTAFAGLGFAQQSTIQGIVTDAGDASIPGATMTVTNVRTGVSQKVKSSEIGLYSIPFLVPGTYSIRAEADGFSTKTLANLKLDVGATARADIQLAVGSVESSIQVISVARLPIEWRSERACDNLGRRARPVHAQPV